MRAIFRHEGLPLGAIRAVGGGQVNRVYQVGREYILRLGVIEGAAERLTREAELLRALSGDLPVPEVLACGVLDGAPYQVQRWAPGRKLYILWPDMRPRAQARITAELAGYLRALHAHACGGFGAAGAPADPGRSWQDYFTSSFQACLAEYARLGIATLPGVLEMAASYVERHAGALAEGTPVLVHRDLWPGNILVSGGRITAMLDFEYAMQAPRDYELLKPQDFCLYPNDYAEGAPKNYTAADFASFLPLLRRAYPELFAVPRLAERLSLYHIDSAVRDYLAWRKANLATIPPERMDASGFLAARVANFTFDHGVRLIGG